VNSELLFIVLYLHAKTMAGSNASYMNYDPRIVEIKSKVRHLVVVNT